MTKQQNVFFRMPQTPQNLLRQQIDIILTEISNICSLLGRDNTEPPLTNLYCFRAHYIGLEAYNCYEGSNGITVSCFNLLLDANSLKMSQIKKKKK